MNTSATPFSISASVASAPAFTPTNTTPAQNTFKANAPAFNPTGSSQTVPQNLNANASSWTPPAQQQMMAPQMQAAPAFNPAPQMNSYNQPPMQAPQHYNNFQPQMQHNQGYNQFPPHHQQQQQYGGHGGQYQQQPRYNNSYNQPYNGSQNYQGQQNYNNRPYNAQKNYEYNAPAYQPKQQPAPTFNTKAASFNLANVKSFEPTPAATAFKPMNVAWNDNAETGYDPDFTMPNKIIKTKMSLTSSSFEAFTPKTIPKDLTKEALKELKITQEEEIAEFKKIIQAAKDNKVGDDAPEPADSQKYAFPPSEGAINMDVFLLVGKLTCCQTQDATSAELSTLVKAEILDRKVFETIEQKKGGYRNDKNKQRQGGYGGGYNNDFAKGTARPNKPNSRGEGPWKQEDSEEKQKLKKMAESIRDKLKGAKNVVQKIRLLLNVITPDNHDKKFLELREYMFPGMKTRAECDEEGIDFIEAEHLLTSDNFNSEILDTVIQNLLKKANTEKEYQIFYGQLCNEIVRLELQLRGLIPNNANQKTSTFRQQLINVCKEHFDVNTSNEERKKHEGDMEAQFKFQDRMFGNINFVGELYRINLLKQSAISQIFTELMGTNTDGEYQADSEIDDLKIEGSVNLMNKIGKTLEENLAKTNKKKDPKKNSGEVFVNIFKTFDTLMGEGETRIQNRVKLLIKNMFSNKDSNWEKTKKKNEERPKTKAEVHNEMVKQYDDQQTSHHHQPQQQDDDGYYNTKGGYNQNRKDGRGGRDKRYNNEKAQYQAKTSKGDGQGRGRGRRDREEPRRQVEVVPIDDTKVADFLKKNFDAFLDSKRLGKEESGEEEEKAEQQQPKKKEVDLSIYRKLEREHGRSQDDILYQLLSRCFFDCEQSDLPELSSYLLLITKEKGILKGGGLSDGISSIIAKMGELALDSPKIPLYLHDYAIKPLFDVGLLHLSKVQWGRDPPKDDDDEDDTLFWNAHELFRLIALTLQTVMISKKCSLEKAVEEISSPKQPLLPVLKTRAARLDEKDKMWSDMDEELEGPDAAAIKAWLEKAI